MNKHILCVYATRQIDSNLFMSSTIFHGLQLCGYKVDMLFAGYRDVCKVFSDRYAKYFDKVSYFVLSESRLKRLCNKSEKTKLIYSYIIHFIKDWLFLPKSIRKVKLSLDSDYDVILSFIPPAISGYWSQFIRKKNHLNSVPLIQFWTDPLSLGRCNDFSSIPKHRFIHKIVERQLLSYSDKSVFCYPLLCEMEQKLHPKFSNKMTWSDVGYTEHLFATRNSSTNISGRVKIGLFGNYQSKVRNIFPLLDAISKIPEVLFIIRGDSDIHIDGSLFSNLDIIEGRRPVSEIEQLEAECNILICLGGKSGITHPAGKVFYYANYPKPIVYIGDGVHNEYFKNYLSGFNRYIICDNNTDSIIDGIHQAITSLPSFVLELDKRLEPSEIARKIVSL